MLRGLFMSWFSWFKTFSWAVYNNVQYGLTSAESCDLYLLNKGSNPAIVFIHGGGWSAGDKSAYQSLAQNCAKQGYCVVSINFRLSDNAGTMNDWNTQLQDCQLAIRWLRQNAATFRIDPNRIVAAGDSAGGQLALLLGMLDKIATPIAGVGGRDQMLPAVSPKANMVWDMFGPTDVSIFSTVGVFSKLTPDQLAQAGPINNVAADCAPTWITHGTQDTVVPYQQSVALDQKLTSLGVDHTLISYVGGHEFSGLTSSQQAALANQALSWLSARLHPDPSNS